MESCLYVGTVSHRRREPVEHAFRYPLFMLYLDLDEIPDVFSRRWLWSASRPAPARFHREDHWGDPELSLRAAIEALVEERTGRRVEGPIRLLTHPRYLGFGFNPVSFYYCYDAAGDRLAAIVAEINNTPWGEQYCYVLDVSKSTSLDGALEFALQKDFHISPFMPMDMDYGWTFTEPAEDLGVHMRNRERGHDVFDATLRMRREPITTWSLNTKLVTYPAMTAQVVAGIYWHALRLWWKRCPVHDHPGTRHPSIEPRRP